MGFVRTIRRTIQIPKTLADDAKGAVSADGFSSLPELVSHLLRNYLVQREAEVK